MARSPGIAIVLLGAVLAASGCSWAPVQPDEPVADTSWSRWGTASADEAPAVAFDGPARPAAHALELAHGLIGAPYRWGGATPAGFDCSGLVYYTFRQAGVEVPRTSRAQFRAATPVPRHAVQRGDLVFFGERGRISHVGIYAGGGQFIHAPVAGRPVTLSSLGEDYYRARFAGAGRLD